MIFSDGPNLNTHRAFHTATLLQNGKLLVAGGTNDEHNFPTDDIPLASAEVYDPDSGTWTITGNLNAARSYHTATLMPGGKVLVAGGVSFQARVAELYDPDTGTWSKTGDLIQGREVPTATLLANGKVLVAGGWNGFSRINGSELYDSATETWSITGDLNAARSGHTATLLPGGKVLVAGGPGNSFSAELYDPATGIWAGTANLNTPRSGHTATLLPDGKVLVAGGGAGSALDSAELYDPAVAGPVAIPKITSASVAGKKLFVVGENFDAGAVILLNGKEQKTRNDEQNPQTALIGKKTGNKVKPGDKLQVRNPNDTLSAEFTFPGS